MKMIRTSLGLLTVLIMTLLSSCSGGNGDAMKLLKYVPDDATLVYVAEYDLFTDDNAALAPEGVQSLLRADVVEHKPFVGVMIHERAYLTGLIEDVKAFADCVGKDAKTTPREESGVKYAGRYAWNDEMFWVSLMENEARPADIKRLLEVKEKESMAASAYASTLCKGDKDIVWLCNLGRVCDIAGSEGAQGRMALSVVFNGAEWIAGSCEVKKQSMEFDARVLDSRFKEAEYLLPAGKIDTGVFDYLHSGNMLFAIDLPAELVSRLASLAQAAGAGSFMEKFNGIDGTAALAFTGNRTASVVITVSDDAAGKNVANGLVMLSGEEDVKLEGHNVIMRTKDATGKLSLPGTDKMKGAILGFAANGAGLENKMIKSVYMVVEKEDKSLEINGEITLEKGVTWAQFAANK